MTSGDNIRAVLKWDDPWGASANDYDLLLYDNTLTLVKSSEDIQDGNDEPYEFLAYTATYTGTYYLSIGAFGNPAVRNFDLYSYDHDLRYRTATGSITVPADSPRVLTVGAVPWNSPSTIEPFSSQGPNKSGVIKPDLVAPDGVSTATYGTASFYGTSAAAPATAGVAALVKNRFPAYTQAQIKSYLETQVVPLGSPGKDNVYGSGRLQLSSLFPVVSTLAATNITNNAATLNGDLTSLGGATAVNVSFEYGKTISYGNVTTAQAKTAAGTFTANISGLTQGSTYHYRAKAVGDVTSYGADRTFIPDTVVTFSDPNIEAAIRQALNKPSGSILRSDLLGLTGFNASRKNIANLSGLEYATNLTTLDLGINQISDIVPLASLTKLTMLDLGINQISSISPLASLTNLTHLYLYDNQISNISLLAPLINLTSLLLTDNQISDITPLASLTKLTELYLGANQISDISPLIANAGLSSGDTVDLRSNPLSANSFTVIIPQLQAKGVTVTVDTQNPPAVPVNVFPVNRGKVGSLTPTLQTSAFSDANVLDTHLASRWQVTTQAGNYASPVFDSGTDTAHLTSIKVPAGKLSRNVTYYWHVRHQDSRGTWSDWSAETAFTIVLAGDANGDGKVNAVDITRTERIIAGLDSGTPLADASLDGSINALDITSLERIIAGLD